MSKYENVQAEAKEKFLGFLIANDFEVGKYLRDNDTLGAIEQMQFIINKIYSMANSNELKELSEQLDYWAAHARSWNRTEVLAAYRKLCKILNDRFYCEFHLGLIPTSTLPTESAKPTHEAVNPKQTSRL